MSFRNDAENENFAAKIVDAPVLLGEGYYRYRGIGICKRCGKAIVQHARMKKYDSKKDKAIEKPSDDIIQQGILNLMEKNHVCAKKNPWVRA